jgi:site-specific recombinase XerD
MDIELLAESFHQYSRYIKGLSKQTIKRSRAVINLFCKRTQINEINEIKTDKVRLFFMNGRTEYKWQSSTFITYYMVLTVFFKWCMKEGYLSDNPINDIEKPKLEKRLPTKLTKQDSLKLLEVIYNYPYNFTFLRYRNHAIFSTLIFAGLRRKELLNLKLTDVDIENLTIFVNQGKGNKDRIIPMSFTLAQTLKRYLEERKRLNKTCAEFFCSLTYNMGFTTHGLKRLVIQMRKASGITFGIHKLRHTFATLMLEGGCDIYSLSKMMGHSDIKTTTIYLSASAEHLRSQIIKHPLND